MSASVSSVLRFECAQDGTKGGSGNGGDLWWKNRLPQGVARDSGKTESDGRGLSRNFRRAVGSRSFSPDQIGDLRNQRTLDPSCSPSASPSAPNILRGLASAHKSPITTGSGRKPLDNGAPPVTRNSLSPAICLQTSRLWGFSTELVSD